MSSFVDNILQLCDRAKSFFVLGLQRIILIHSRFKLYPEIDQLLSDRLELISNGSTLSRTLGDEFGVVCNDAVWCHRTIIRSLLGLSGIYKNVLDSASS